MKIGKDQLRLLMMAASPTTVLITPNRSSNGLVKRGLFVEDEHGGCTISPAGLRALADEMDAGRVRVALAAMKAEMEKRRKART